MNPVPFLWLAAVVGFLLLEASTFSMTSVWFAVGAAAALLTCLFTGSFRVQALVFIVVSALCLLMFRPLAAKLRQKSIPCGSTSTSVRMVEPVVVKPLTVSKKASAKFGMQPEIIKGSAPITNIRIHESATMTKPSRE